MHISFTKLKHLVLLVFVCLISFANFGQSETNKLKAQIAFGFNKTVGNGQSAGFSSKTINFPTINLGVQYMFSETLGAKLDFGYNRSSNDKNSPEFKLNYSRVNGQLVYDFSKLFSFFLPPRFAVIGHTGLGISFSKPLGSYVNNKYTFINGIIGGELHYGISQTVSIFGDASLILPLSKKDKYNSDVDGYSFNGKLLTTTIGVSVSLSGCQYCD